MRRENEARDILSQSRKKVLPFLLVAALIALEGCATQKGIIPKATKKDKDDIGAVIQPVAKNLAAKAIGFSREGDYYFEAFSVLSGPHVGQTELQFDQTEPDGEIDDIEVFIAGQYGNLKPSSVVEVEIGFVSCSGSVNSPNCSGRREKLFAPSQDYEGVPRWAAKSTPFTMNPYNGAIHWEPTSDTVNHIPGLTSAVYEGQTIASTTRDDFASIMSIAQHASKSPTQHPVLTSINLFPVPSSI